MPAVAGYLLLFFVALQSSACTSQQRPAALAAEVLGADTPRTTVEGSPFDSLQYTRPQVSDEFLVTCPFCGEQLEIYVEPDVHGTFVQDCEVCCNPWRVSVSGRAEDRAVHVARADGSE
jgi:hypothetical protein